MRCPGAALDQTGKRKASAGDSCSPGTQWPRLDDPPIGDRDPRGPHSPPQPRAWARGNVSSLQPYLVRTQRTLLNRVCGRVRGGQGLVGRKMKLRATAGALTGGRSVMTRAIHPPISDRARGPRTALLDPVPAEKKTAGMTFRPAFWKVGSRTRRHGWHHQRHPRTASQNRELRLVSPLDPPSPSLETSRWTLESPGARRQRSSKRRQAQ